MSPSSHFVELTACVEAFTRSLQHERRASPNTVLAYRRDLEVLTQYLREKLGRPPRLDDVSKLVLRGFMGEQSRRLKPMSLARRLASVRALFVYLERMGKVRSNPARQIKMPRRRKPLPTFLSQAQASRVIEAPLRDAAPEAVRPLRDAVILELLYGAGLRVSELVGLNIEDVSLERDELRVIGKGDKERRIPLGALAKRAFIQYLKVRSSLCHPRSGFIDERALLVNRRGGRLSVRWVQKLTARYGMLGARPDLHPHALRHSCATHMLEGGADLRVIQEFLGHESLATTERYTHLTLDKLLRVYDDSHPLARRAGGAPEPNGGRHE